MTFNVKTIRAPIHQHEIDPTLVIHHYNLLHIKRPKVKTLKAPINHNIIHNLSKFLCVDHFKDLSTETNICMSACKDFKQETYGYVWFLENLGEIVRERK